MHAPTLPMPTRTPRPPPPPTPPRNLRAVVARFPLWCQNSNILRTFWAEKAICRTFGACLCHFSHSVDQVRLGFDGHGHPAGGPQAQARRHRGHRPCGSVGLAPTTQPAACGANTQQTRPVETLDMEIVKRRCFTVMIEIKRTKQ